MRELKKTCPFASLHSGEQLAYFKNEIMVRDRVHIFICLKSVKLCLCFEDRNPEGSSISVLLSLSVL
jgi:hypothetical protein